MKNKKCIYIFLKFVILKLCLSLEFTSILNEQQILNGKNGSIKEAWNNIIMYNWHLKH